MCHSEKVHRKILSMNSRERCVLVSFLLHLLLYGANEFAEGRYPVSRGFLGFRPVSTFEKSCTCETSYSCSCCQSVTILYTMAEKNLCVNFFYEKSGLNINATLNSDTLKNRTVTDYNPLKFCANIPGCYFSTACVNVLELNEFPKSITTCLRLDILSKKRIWQLNYDCVSISSELPMKSGNGTMQTMNGTAEMDGMSTTTKAGMTSAMTSSQMTMTTTMTTDVETEETTTPDDVEVITRTETVSITLVDID